MKVLNQEHCYGPAPHPSLRFADGGASFGQYVGLTQIGMNTLMSAEQA